MNKSESIKHIAGALIKLQGEIGKACKDGNNPHYKSKYATLEAVSDVARQPLIDNELVITQVVIQDERGSLLETVLIHVSGEWMSSAVPIIDKRGDMQGFGSGLTYARRYGLAGILQITQEDDDGNGTTKTTKTETKPHTGQQGQSQGDTEPTKNMETMTETELLKVIESCKTTSEVNKKASEFKLVEMAFAPSVSDKVKKAFGDRWEVLNGGK